MEKIKQEVAGILEEAIEEYSKDVDLGKEDIQDLIEIPPNMDMGDYAFPCFSLSKQLKTPPYQIALELRRNIGSTSDIVYDIQTSGPYINFILDKRIMASKILREIFNNKKEFGQPDNPPASDKEKNKRVKTMVEFPSPNTNKPLHLGHLRNMAIGESVSRISEFNKEDVIRANLNNDRGIHICQSMAAYKYYGKDRTPSKANQKPDHFVGHYYVLFKKNAEKDGRLERDSHRMLQKYEEGDKETLKLWKKMNNWALKGFRETYRKFGIEHDKEYFESDVYKKGKDIVQEGLKKELFEKDKNGAVVVKFSEKDLGEKYLLRQDGTSLYITQDLYLAKTKFDDYNLDKSIYVTGDEQKYHFRVLFKLLDMLEIADRERMEHLAYGMVELPEGKMKSREGRIVDADDLIHEVEGLVRKELKARPENKNLSEKTIEKRSRTIALASIKYLLLKVDINKKITFDPKKSMDFEGNTGSYLLYTYARAASIIRKIKSSDNKEVVEHTDTPIDELDQKEKELVKKLSLFEKAVQKAYDESNPSLIANYTFELAQIFNEFYHACPVMKSEKQDFRKRLVRGFKKVMYNSLHLLGIEPLEKM